MANTLDRRIRAMRTWLLARRAELRDRVRRVETDARREPGAPCAGTGGPDLVVEREDVLGRIRKATLDELYFIRSALRRIDLEALAAGEKGGGEIIDPARIEITPHATCYARYEPEN